MSWVIYIHRSCPTSLALLDALRQEGVIGKVSIIDVSTEPFKLLGKGIVSVPVIEYDGIVVDFGPIDIDGVVQAIKNDSFQRAPCEDFDQCFSKLRRVVYDNLFLTLGVYLREKVSWVLDLDAVRSVIGVDKGKFEDFRAFVRENEEKAFESMKEKLLKVMAYNFKLELRILFGEGKVSEKIEALDVDYVVHWLLARSSVARVGLLEPIQVDYRSKAEEFLAFLKKN